MSNIVPVFSSHYSMDYSSLLTLEEAGKTKAGNPISICDIARDNNLKQVVLVDSKIDGFNEAYKNIQKAGISQLVYGLKLCICANMTDKTDESLATESNVIIFIKNSQGYNDLIRIQSRAWTDGFYYRGRVDHKLLKTYWTDNLSLALPFFSSFIQRNTLTMSNIVPDFPVPPVLFKEIDSGLPFAPMIEMAVDQFAAANNLTVQPVKSVYYMDGEKDFEAYSTFRAIGNRAEFARPNVDHMGSNRFSFRAWQELIKERHS